MAICHPSFQRLRIEALLTHLQPECWIIVIQSFKGTLDGDDTQSGQLPACLASAFSARG